MLKSKNLLKKAVKKGKIRRKKKKKDRKGERDEKMKKERIWLKDTPYAKEWHKEKNHPLQLEALYHQSAKLVWWKCSVCSHEWQLQVAKRTEGRECPNCRLKRQSLAAKAPQLVLEWDDEKNAPLTPKDIFFKSAMSVWWKCQSGHSYEMSPSQRSQIKGCPICKKLNHLERQALVKHYPEVAKTWHPMRNQPLTVEEVTKGSQKKVWWQCAKGHEWEMTVASRVRTSTCPICTKQDQLIERSLGVKHPELIKEWHPVLNKGLTPFDVLAKSNKKAWWRCEHGHEWEATILSRANGTGCLKCYHSRNVQDYSLPQRCPELVKEWHSTKNGHLTPDQLTYRSGRLVWWQCEKGHEWEASPNVRYSSKGCPICRQERQRLTNCYPNYEQFFDVEKNHPLRYHDLSVSSSEAIWWTCERGHSRQTRVRSFLNRPTCPRCQQWKDGVLVDSFAQRCPDLVKEWHPMKNGTLTPDQLKWKSSQVVWWRCEQGHEWESKVVSRTNGSGCPSCRQKKHSVRLLSPIEKEQLNRQWHSTKNENVSLEDCFPLGKQHVWWRCDQPNCRHEWEDSVVRRLKGYGCPECRIREDSVASRYPELVNIWNHEKNKPLTIERFYHKSVKSVWWQCEAGHLYRRSVATQLKQKNCPKCLKNQKEGCVK